MDVVLEGVFKDVKNRRRNITSLPVIKENVEWVAKYHNVSTTYLTYLIMKEYGDIDHFVDTVFMYTPTTDNDVANTVLFICLTLIECEEIVKEYLRVYNHYLTILVSLGNSIDKALLLFQYVKIGAIKNNITLKTIFADTDGCKELLALVEQLISEEGNEVIR